jgi:hypothetical protein
MANPPQQTPDLPPDASARRPIVCIFGSYAPKPGDPLWQTAYDIGHQLATAGYDVCNGGYDGTMFASAQGAKDAGGATIGVTCSIFGGYRGKKLEANPAIDTEIHHEDVLDRIQEMMHMGVAYVVLEGGTGTLSELGIIWEFVAKGLIEPRPIFVVGDFWRPLVERVVSARRKHGKHIHCVDTAEEIVGVLTDLVPAEN